MKVFVVFSKLDENYGNPFKVFSSKGKMEEWMKTHKDDWGLDYCWEEIEIDE